LESALNIVDWIGYANDATSLYNDFLAVDTSINVYADELASEGGYIAGASADVTEAAVGLANTATGIIVITVPVSILENWIINTSKDIQDNYAAAERLDAQTWAQQQRTRHFTWH
jgi:hypothetical protein